MIPTLQAMCRRPEKRGEEETSAEGNFKQHGTVLDTHPQNSSTRPTDAVATRTGRPSHLAKAPC